MPTSSTRCPDGLERCSYTLDPGFAVEVTAEINRYREAFGLPAARSADQPGSLTCAASVSIQLRPTCSAQVFAVGYASAASMVWDLWALDEGDQQQLLRPGTPQLGCAATIRAPDGQVVVACTLT